MPMHRRTGLLARVAGVICSLLAAVTILHPQPARAQEEIDVGTFYQELEPHGRWFEHEQYGYVWSPRIEDPDWRPYTRGHWEWTDEYGWYWQSSEPWGWGPYHYGRWFLDDDAGWVWIPGTEWGPAWVAWRESDDYIGWAPLPPDSTFGSGGMSIAAGYYDSPRWTPIWSFVAPRYMTHRGGVYAYLQPYRHNVTIIGRTRFINNYARVDNRIVNRGVDFRFVERRGGIRITPLRVVAVDNRSRIGINIGGGGAVMVYRPRISRGGPAVRPAHIARREDFRAERRVPGMSFIPRGGNTDRDGRPGPRPDRREDVRREDDRRDNDRRFVRRDREEDRRDGRDLRSTPVPNTDPRTIGRDPATGRVPPRSVTPMPETGRVAPGPDRGRPGGDARDNGDFVRRDARRGNDATQPPPERRPGPAQNDGQSGRSPDTTDKGTPPDRGPRARLEGQNFARERANDRSEGREQGGPSRNRGENQNLPKGKAGGRSARDDDGEKGGPRR